MNDSFDQLVKAWWCRAFGHQPDAQGYGDVSFKVCKRCGKVYDVTLINPGLTLHQVQVGQGTAWRG